MAVRSGGSSTGGDRTGTLGSRPSRRPHATHASSAGATDDADELPTSIRAIIAARLDALPPDERAALIDAAVVGRVFWKGALARIDDTRDLSALLGSLEQRDLVRREAVSRIQGDHQFAIKHGLIRDVAYQILPRAGRRERHAAVAEYLHEKTGDVGQSTEALAHHWQEAGENQRAVDCLLVAADQAVGQVDHGRPQLGLEADHLADHLHGDLRGDLLGREVVDVEDHLGGDPFVAQGLDDGVPRRGRPGRGGLRQVAEHGQRAAGPQVAGQLGHVAGELEVDAGHHVHAAAGDDRHGGRRRALGATRPDHHGGATRRGAAALRTA